MKRPVIARTLASLAAVALAACGGNGSVPDGGPVADASTRIGWDQQADTPAEIATFHFVMYADGVRHELPGASCSTPAGPDGFPCSVLLPPLEPGQHLIEIASYVRKASIVFESPKSPAVVVTVGGPSSTAVIAGSSPSTADSAPPDSSSAAASGDIATRDGVLLHVDIAAAVSRPSALATGLGGELLVGDASGIVTVIRDGVVEGRSPIDDDGGASSGPVLGLALDPDFSRNHYVYGVDAVPGDPPTFRLARFREAGGRLGERAVLLSDVPASSVAPAASIAFGQDARLYIAFDDGGDPERARAAASYNGKVLRLNADGTTPADRQVLTPLFASDLRSPRSIEWDGASGSLWVADLDGAVRLRPTRRGIVRTAYALPITSGAASLSMYRAALIPGLQGSLLVATNDGGLLRLQLPGGDESMIGGVEPLALPGGPRVRLVHVGADGAIYAGTDRAVVRIAPRQ